MPGIAAVNDDGELGGVGEFHLLAEDTFLEVARGMVVEIIETDFAPGDDFGMLREAGKCVQMGQGDLPSFVGMDADRGVNPIPGFGVGESGVQFVWARAGTDGEQRCYTRGLGASEHGVAVSVELGEIDVSVGVNELHDSYQQSVIRYQEPANQALDSFRVITLLQTRTYFYVFEETSQDGPTVRANGSGDDHAVGLDAAKLSGGEVHNDDDFAADE